MSGRLNYAGLEVHLASLLLGILIGLAIGVPIGGLGRRRSRRHEAGPPRRAGPRRWTSDLALDLDGPSSEATAISPSQVSAVPWPPAAAPTPTAIAVPAPDDGHAPRQGAAPEIPPVSPPSFRATPPPTDVVGEEEEPAAPTAERDLLAELLDTNRRLAADAERLRREVPAAEEVLRPEPRLPRPSPRVEPPETAPPAGEPPRPSAASLLELHERLNRDARARLRRDQDSG
jgi:hypothetical protein